ncbi:beta-parvin [Perognathus longimembris pacificus]|uniref:beta-parvin n=1 Tax=Perognathus longimembris pacificus TaxID=214514 RepID=UPI0020190AE6|nr:beta-parvin [Perognathus longimembris pacificus]
MRKDESFLGKLGGTLARRKKAREVSDLQEEGKSAINSPMSPAAADAHPGDTQLEENEERTMIDPTSREDPKFKELVKVRGSEPRSSQPAWSGAAGPGHPELLPGGGPPSPAPGRLDLLFCFLTGLGLELRASYLPCLSLLWLLKLFID